VSQLPNINRYWKVGDGLSVPGPVARIQAQHLGYAVTGLGIGVTESLAETKTRWHAFFAKVWPTLMMVLGVLLMVYTE